MALGGLIPPFVTALLIVAAAAAKAACPEGSVAIPGGKTACLSRLEVTVDDYAACVAAHRCTPRGTHRQCNGVHRGLGSHPANCVSQPQAKRYCAWAGGRLPTGDEWKLAARTVLPKLARAAGTQPPADVCWNDPAGETGTCEVASFCAPGAICDLAGNVAEWTSTIEALAGGRQYAIVHGGGWIFEPLTYAAELDPAFRRRLNPASRLVDVGLRCAFDGKVDTGVVN